MPPSSHNPRPQASIIFGYLSHYLAADCACVWALVFWLVRAAFGFRTLGMAQRPNIRRPASFAITVSNMPRIHT